MEVLRFQDWWIKEDNFHDWLVKVNNDERRAYCRFCAIVLRAHKPELLAHYNSALHAKSLRENLGAPVGPISVQIVCQEEEEEDVNNETTITGDVDMSPQFIVPNNEVDDDEEEEEEDEDDVVVVQNAINGVSTLPSSSPRKRPKRTRSDQKCYIKKYRPAWESSPEFKDWLLPFPNDIQKAFCRVCKTVLRAHRHDLSCHGRTARHQKKMVQDKEAEQGEEQSQDIVEENVVTIRQGQVQNHYSITSSPTTPVTSTSTPSFVSIDQLDETMRRINNTSPRPNSANVIATYNGSGIEIIETVDNFIPVISSPLTPPPPAAMVDIKSTIIRVGPSSSSSSPSPRLRGGEIIVQRSSPPKPPPPQSPTTMTTPTRGGPAAVGLKINRFNITANDVISAIDNNEFTGYELLQIVKKAVRKL